MARERARRERERARREREHTLDRAEIERVVFAYGPEIRACYERHALGQPRATGELSLALIIHRDGSLFQLEVSAPGVRDERLGKCVRRLADDWRFPPRKGFTDAIVPFRYVRTVLPGAGPYYSCWDPRGCSRHRKRDRQPAPQ